MEKKEEKLLQDILQFYGGYKEGRYTKMWAIGSIQILLEEHFNGKH